MAPQTQFCRVCHRTYGPAQPFCPLDGSALHTVPEDLPGPGSMVGGRYLVVSPVADGGMGAIFRAQDLRRHREVALKVLKPALAAKEQAVARFFVEARAARRLNHPNIIDLYDFGVSGEGYLYLAMEMLPGATLAALLSRRNRLATGEALLVAFGVAEALVHAHRNGVVHRDLKPENIFLVAWDRDGYFVKVLDFGVAAIADAHIRGGLGRGEVLGTPAYMSPEQVRGDVVDRRSDLYSLGIVIYEMLAGLPPFLADSAAETMHLQLSREAPPLPPLAVSTTVRRGVEALLASMLAKSPDARAPAAGDIRARIRAVLDDLAAEDARAVDAELFRETLAPLRTTVPFHERDTMMFDPSSIDALMHNAPTLVLDPGEPGVLQSSPTRVLDPGSAAAVAAIRAAAPWTVSGEFRAVTEAPPEETIEVSLLHVELDFGPQEGGVLPVRQIFGPEMEAFQAQAMASGGCVCFDSGDEVRLVFGLYERGEQSWDRAVRTALDLRARVRRFGEATRFPVQVRAGVATAAVPARTASTPSPDAALRGSAADLAVRLARMALAGQVLLDETTRQRAGRGLDFDDVGRIKVRGRVGTTRIFALAPEIEAEALPVAAVAVACS